MAGEGGAGGSGGAADPDLPTCIGLEKLVPSNPIVEDEGGDGVWSRGESATLTVTLTNTSDTFYDYPGLVVDSDNALVTSDFPNAPQVFGISAHEGTAMRVTFDADAALPHGTTVHFTATVTKIGQRCSESKSIGFDATID